MSSRPRNAPRGGVEELNRGSAEADSEIARLRDTIAQLMHTSVHDTLTGLPNRSFLLERLEQELARDAADGANIAILFVDLDNFKLVNDSLGHGSGDEVLIEMARRLVGCIGSEDIASRFGGDEMVILHSCATGDSGAALGERILAALSEPIFVSGKEVVMSASVGLALCRPGTKSAGQLLREADTALYAAKGRGRARLEQFNDELHARAQKRVQIESDLRAALRASQLFVEYQPQVRLKDGRVVGVEALVRWRHPRHGIIPPGDFISVAEDCGLIIKVGRQVLQESCRQLAEWTKLMPGRTLAMTVNVSPRQIMEPAFVGELRQILADANIDPATLCLELTENVMMSATEEVARLLNEIRQLGVFIAIDDFGTEHSSLSRLRDMPAEVLKIDRSFIDGLSSEPGDTAIVSSILSLAYAMGKHTIAEGVEKREQAAMLLRMGCEVAQGYFFSRPVAAEQIVPMLSKALWQPDTGRALHAAHFTEELVRRGHRYFIDEFLDHIGAPMGTKTAASR
ncbi:bifunctional diguanylate cyclase/phosphodiesterase [Bradyrhizobium jicamae]|uniref:Bifunctional diguanylate cyclase/phosphodiesterase n=1 Tax=Bradyrhizobium jicamae TaxID=280332 RepID=A0ABS5FM71_9BRAD|nr:bifunctional diguanylate cyclase/phosphodiesterase [Bradyrhizobium jicamae]MBR0797888.1 bifunctional diguanylate cyclase/phosphodiesterase [Bradyrhizobium jicamae]